MEEKSVGDQIGCDVASSTHHAVSRTIFQHVHHVVHREMFCWDGGGCVCSIMKVSGCVSSIRNGQLFFFIFPSP